MIVFMIILGIVIMVGILGLTLLTISKGYGYEHKIDPLPEDKEDNDQSAS